MKFEAFAIDELSVSSVDPAMLAERAELSEAVSEMLKEFDPLSRKLVLNHFGFVSPPRSIAQLAQIVGHSESYIRRRLHGAMAQAERKLRGFGRAMPKSR